MILIDGRGPNGSSDAFSWPNMPGHIVHFEDTEQLSYAVGDAKLTYDWTPSNAGRLKAVPHEEAGLLWVDVVYGKSRENLSDYGEFYAKPLIVGHGSKTHLFEYNPVQRAYRSAILVKGEYPFVLIVDDIQKDDEAHEYAWVGNFDIGSIEKISSEKDRVLLKKKYELDKGNELLVVALQADGLAHEPTLLNSIIGGKNGKKVTQIRITTKGTLTPNFKTLLYPDSKGAPQPLIQWNDAKNQVTIKIADQIKNISFIKNEQGITEVEIN